VFLTIGNFFVTIGRVNKIIEMKMESKSIAFDLQNRSRDPEKFSPGLGDWGMENKKKNPLIP
jgi:hypothetical protein